MHWKLITSEQEDGRIYWTSSPHPNGIVAYESKARYTRGVWKTMIGRKWVPYTPQPTHYRPVDGAPAIQSLYKFKPGVGVLSITDIAA